MLAEKRRLARKIHSLETKLSALPAGKLYCTANGAYHKYYHFDDHHKTYIPKSNFTLVEQLAKKEYLSRQILDLKNESDAIDLYLQHRKKHPARANELTLASSPYQPLLAASFHTSAANSPTWENAPFYACPYHPEALIHPTASGRMVRSKSEALIDSVLTKYGLAFRYECALTFGEKTIFPDFTIHHNGKIYYWEHFGKISNPEYRKTVHEKIDFYIDHGILPSKNLLTTYETANQPLTCDVVDNLVQTYLL